MQDRKKRELDLSVGTGNTVQAFRGPWGLYFQISERTALRERIGARCTPEWENELLGFCWMKRKMKRREWCSETLFCVACSSAVSYQFRVGDCSMTWWGLRWDQRANCIAIGIKASAKMLCSEPSSTTFSVVVMAGEWLFEWGRMLSTFFLKKTLIEGEQKILINALFAKITARCNGLIGRKIRLLKELFIHNMHPKPAEI